MYSRLSHHRATTTSAWAVWDLTLLTVAHKGVEGVGIAGVGNAALRKQRDWQSDSSVSWQGSSTQRRCWQRRPQLYAHSLSGGTRLLEGALPCHLAESPLHLLTKCCRWFPEELWADQAWQTELSGSWVCLGQEVVSLWDLKNSKKKGFYCIPIKIYRRSLHTAQGRKARQNTDSTSTDLVCLLRCQSDNYKMKLPLPGAAQAQLDISELCVTSWSSLSLQDMQWSQEYAFHNRRFMMDLLLSCINDVVHKSPEMEKLINRSAKS